MEDAPADQRAKALNNRGVSKGQAGDSEGAIADFNAVIEMEDAPADQRAYACANLARRYIGSGKLAEALMVATAAILSGILSDDGLKMIEWFSKEAERLREIVCDTGLESTARGSALAFLVAIDRRESKDFIARWMKDEGFAEAAKICLEINTIWQARLPKPGDQDTESLD